jgi:hypothetical protein
LQWALGGFGLDAVGNISWEQNREDKLKFTIQGTYEFTTNPLKNKTNLDL